MAFEYADARGGRARSSWTRTTASSRRSTTTDDRPGPSRGPRRSELQLAQGPRSASATALGGTIDVGRPGSHAPQLVSRACRHGRRTGSLSPSRRGVSPTRARSAEWETEGLRGANEVVALGERVPLEVRCGLAGPGAQLHADGVPLEARRRPPPARTPRAPVGSNGGPGLGSRRTRPPRGRTSILTAECGQDGPRRPSSSARARSGLEGAHRPEPPQGVPRPGASHRRG